MISSQSPEEFFIYKIVQVLHFIISEVTFHVQLLQQYTDTDPGYGILSDIVVANTACCSEKSEEEKQLVLLYLG